MKLTIGDIPDYNNKIVIATAAHDLGRKEGVKATIVPPKHTQTVQGTKNKTESWLLCLFCLPSVF